MTDDERYGLPDACSECHELHSTHDPRYCYCTQPLCMERGVTRVSRHAKHSGALLCKRHTRWALARAERYGYAVVLTSPRPYEQPLPLTP